MPERKRRPTEVLTPAEATAEGYAPMAVPAHAELKAAQTQASDLQKTATQNRVPSSFVVVNTKSSGSAQDDRPFAVWVRHEASNDEE